MLVIKLHEVTEIFINISYALYDRLQKYTFIQTGCKNNII